VQYVIINYLTFKSEKKQPFGMEQVSYALHTDTYLGIFQGSSIQPPAVYLTLSQGEIQDR